MRARNPDCVVVFGGPHPTCEPEDTLRHCDFVVTNEGEEPALELLDRLDSEAPGNISNIEGLSFRGGDGTIVHPPRRAVMQEIDFKLEPGLIHHWPGILGNRTRTGMLRFPFPVVQFSRGRPYSCSSCLGARQLGRKYRTRMAASVVEDPRRLHRLTNFAYGMFHDNDVAIRREETKDLLREMIAAKPGIHKMTAFTRIKSTKHEELWRRFEPAGIANVILGVASLSQNSLDGFNKSTTVEGVHEALDRLDRSGSKIKIATSFVVGNNEDPLRETALIREFWRKFHRRIQRVAIQPPMEYPFQQKLRGQHQLYPDKPFIHYDWDYYAGDYLVFYPNACPPSVFQRALRQTFRAAPEVPEGSKEGWDYRTTQTLIRDTHQRKDRNLSRYVDFLKRMKRGKYGGDGRLKPDALTNDPKPWSVDIGAPTRRAVRIPGWVTAGQSARPDVATAPLPA